MKTAAIDTSSLAPRRFTSRDWKKALAAAERRVEATRESLAFVRSAIGDSAEQDRRQAVLWVARLADAEAALAAIRAASKC